MKDFEKEAEKYKFEGLTVLKPYELENLLINALEGGSNYWYIIGQKSMQFVRKATQDMEGEPLSQRLIMAIQRGVEVRVYYTETNERLGVLNAQSWGKAEKLMMEKHRVHFANAISGNDDAETADIFLQLAVIGELTYG